MIPFVILEFVGNFFIMVSGVLRSVALLESGEVGLWESGEVWLMRTGGSLTYKSRGKYHLLCCILKYIMHAFLLI